MNKLLGSFLLLVIPSLLVGQNMQRIDSLKNKLKQPSLRNRYDLLTNLAWEFRFAYPDSTIIYGQQAYTLADALHLQTDQARSLNYVGVAYNYKGERLNAYDFFTQALEVSTRQKDSTQIAHANNNLGRLFFEQGILAKAYDYFTKSYNIFKKIGDNSGLAYTLQSLGTLQRSQKDYVQSEKNYLEAYQLRLQLHNKRDIMSALMMLSRLYYERKEFEKSNLSLLKADSIGQINNDEINRSEIKMLQAKNYIELGRLNDAEKAAEAGAKVISKSQYTRIQPETMLILGKIKLQKGKLKEAEVYFKSSLKLAIEIKDLQGQMDAFHLLWKLAEANQNKQDAVHYMNQYLVLNDSIKDLDLARQVDRLHFQLEIEKKEKENELLKLNEAHQSVVIDRQRNQNLLLFVVLLFAISSTGVALYYSHKRRQANLMLRAQNKFIELQRKQIEKRNADLSTQNQKLGDLNHEKDMLMNIVAHDLKSPLARIIGLADLLRSEGQLLPSQEEYLRLLKDVTQSNFDLIVDLLDVNALQTGNEELKATVFMAGQLLEERIAFYQYLSISKKIDLQLDHDLDKQIKTNPGYLSRIVDNLVSNAIKFSQNGAKVNVNATVLNGFLTLTVKDNGPGFSEDDKTLLYQRFKKLSARPTAGESSNGLGLAIVKTLIDRLQGDISLKSEQGEGSEFTVRLPVKVVESISA
ncbi:MAG TPA: tetratricopeptide repeat-containing sensor histidine kinase [Cyclobacteriaceae bacterium]|nr:tetratricopeptide repeat-containing sensor histidine kinase [Cyclobacteriaceae bacterium]